jgi:hypothetical protein
MRRLNASVRNAATLLALSLLLPLSFAARKETRETPADKAEAEKWITTSIRPMYTIDQLNSQYLLLSSTRRGETQQYHFGIALARIAFIARMTMRTTLSSSAGPGQKNLRRRSGI